MKCLAILGASGHGKVVADAAACSGWDIIHFFDDAWPGLAANGRWPVIGDSAEFLDKPGKYDGVVVAIGDNPTRDRRLQDLDAAGVDIVSVVHPSAVVSRYAQLGAGSVVFANAVINADTVIGPGAIINTGAVVEHDCWLDRCTHVSPNATLAGGVRLGRRAWIGANACVRQLVSIGDGVIVGMGSVVIRDVGPEQTVVGNPAGPL